uniref:Uncharacterized protein n=1 Tax=Aegilops tauschii TaxID=37682 RepID=M8C7H2_AEGTA
MAELGGGGRSIATPSRPGGRGNGGRPRYRFRSIRLLFPLPSAASSPAIKGGSKW